MSARILVLDAVTTNRIVMMSKLSASHYCVTASEKLVRPDDIATLPPSQQPELIMLDANLSRWHALDLCHTLKTHPATAHIPVLMTLPQELRSIMPDAIEAGADDALVRPLNEQVLLSRLRNLIRANIRTRLLKKDSTDLGQPFLDAIAHDATASRTAFVSTVQTGDASVFRDSIQQTLGRPMETIAWSDILALDEYNHSIDLIIIATDARNTRDPLNLICDLRSRTASRDAAIILLTTSGMEDPALISEALNSGANDVIPFDTNPVELKARLLRQIVSKRRDDALRDRIQSGLRMATTDALTGLHNRRYALNRLSKISQTAFETTEPFAVLMLDVDHFKAINDTHGHGTGDMVLQSISSVLRDNLRDSDLLARIGGEEFLAALPGASRKIALDTADRLRRRIEELSFVDTASQTELKVTISIGMTLSGGELSNDELLLDADRALYAAKAQGRNTVSLSKLAA